jgi:hypothetical protein
MELIMTIVAARVDQAGQQGPDGATPILFFPTAGCARW